MMASNRQLDVAEGYMYSQKRCDAYELLQGPFESEDTSPAVYYQAAGQQLLRCHCYPINAPDQTSTSQTSPLTPHLLRLTSYASPLTPLFCSTPLLPKCTYVQWSKPAVAWLTSVADEQAEKKWLVVACSPRAPSWHRELVCPCTYVRRRNGLHVS